MRRPSPSVDDIIYGIKKKKSDTHTLELRRPGKRERIGMVRTTNLYKEQQEGEVEMAVLKTNALKNWPHYLSSVEGTGSSAWGGGGWRF